MKRIVVIMATGAMKWVDVMPVDEDIFVFRTGNNFNFTCPIVFEGLGVDYFIVT